MNAISRQLGSNTAAQWRWQSIANPAPIGGSRLCMNDLHTAYTRFDLLAMVSGEPMT